MNIIFWQNIPSFHQSATIRALASMQGCEVTLALQEDLSKSFQDSGWLNPEFGKTRLLHLKNDDDISNLISETGDDAVHIFSGIRFPVVRKAFLAAIRTNARIGLLAEAADWRGGKGLARLLLYRLEFLRFSSRIDFTLAMGELGVRWYLRCGFPADKIYPFAYVVEKQTLETSRSSSNGATRLIYVGRFIRRKGLDVLLSALAMHKDLNWRLDLVGDGPECDNLMRQVIEAELADKITFHGALPNDVARKLIASSDCLILPSRWDGWGAVVNEALMQGVPVICSDVCGASDLLGSPERGEVFKAGAVTALGSVLERWICKGNKTQESADRIKSWAKSIEGETVAGYLLDVKDAAAGMKDRPLVPWRDGGQPCA
jgi:glycosyltransferase involved in cell wall biosynthesis